MTEDERRAVQADTLRRLAYYLHAQEVIGGYTDDDLDQSELDWWQTNVREPESGMFYVDSLEEDFAWLIHRADTVESGAWSIPERFYDNDPGELL